MADFFELVEQQRACRAFSNEAVSDVDLAQILRAATFAPSAENKQPWEFIVVREPSTRDAIGALMQRAWETRGRAFSESRLSPKLLAEVDAGATGGVAAAPVIIVVCADTQRGLVDTVPSSIFPATQNLLLAATALGYGSALTTIATGYRAELQALLELPAPVHPVAVIPIGRPTRPLGRPRREPFERRTHRERYGAPW
jgi:nitroreductase